MAKRKRSKLAAWQEQARDPGYCQKCNEVVHSRTVDHIIPVSILNCLDLTGEAMYEDEENFQLLCRPCNTMKAARIDRLNPKTKEIILKYLQ